MLKAGLGIIIAHVIMRSDKIYTPVLVSLREETMKKTLTSVFCLFVAVAFMAACNQFGTVNNPEAIEKVPTTKVQPTPPDIKAMMKDMPSWTLQKVTVPTIVAEACDSQDNNNDGFTDEFCFRCIPDGIRGDTNGDGVITLFDAGAPLLMSFNKTKWASEDVSCADMNQDGVLDLTDTIDIVKAMPH